MSARVDHFPIGFSSLLEIHAALILLCTVCFQRGVCVDSVVTLEQAAGIYKGNSSSIHFFCCCLQNICIQVWNILTFIKMKVCNINSNWHRSGSLAHSMEMPAGHAVLSFFFFLCFTSRVQWKIFMTADKSLCVGSASHSFHHGNRRWLESEWQWLIL